VSEPEIVVVRDPDEGAARAADAIATILSDAVGERGGRADWATTGGSTAPPIYRAMLAPAMRDRIPWEGVHTWWGDDRFVPSDHPLSNVRPFENILMEAGDWESVHSDDPRGRIRIPAASVHPFRTGEAIGVGEDADECARDLAAELRAAELPESDGWPVFDLVLLGIGPDGHVLSVFPGSPAFDARAWALAVPAPTHVEPHVARVTLNPEVARVARRVVVAAFGAAKRDVIGRVFGSEIDPRALPAQLARREGATWIIDEDAAANLPK
jgi:6-phosphogluconolactonase